MRLALVLGPVIADDERPFVLYGDEAAEAMADAEAAGGAAEGRAANATGGDAEAVAPASASAPVDTTSGAGRDPR